MHVPLGREQSKVSGARHANCRTTACHRVRRHTPEGAGQGLAAGQERRQVAGQAGGAEVVACMGSRHTLAAHRDAGESQRRTCGSSGAAAARQPTQPTGLMPCKFGAPTTRLERHAVLECAQADLALQVLQRGGLGRGVAVGHAARQARLARRQDVAAAADAAAAAGHTPGRQPTSKSLLGATCKTLAFY
jgi:hypothetical protein